MPEEISHVDPINIIREKREDIKKYGVKKIGIFGSYTRGEDTEGSDIDILIEFELREKDL